MINAAINQFFINVSSVPKPKSHAHNKIFLHGYHQLYHYQFKSK